jgi:hypothetical protein
MSAAAAFGCAIDGLAKANEYETSANVTWRVSEQEVNIDPPI